MRSPIPSHARRIEIAGQTAWIWATEHGFAVLQWPFQVDLSNIVREGVPSHTVDWRNDSPRDADFEGGLYVSAAGFMDEDGFILVCEELLGRLRTN